MMMDLKAALAAQLKAGHSSETVPMHGPGSASGDLIPHREKSIHGASHRGLAKLRSEPRFPSLRSVFLNR